MYSLRLLVYGNIWVSLAVTSLMWVTFILNDIPPDYFLLTTVFASSIFIYNLQRLIRLNDLQKSTPKIEWVRQNNVLLKVITVVSGSLTLFSAFFLSFPVIFTLTLLALLSFIYAYKFTSDNKSLRQIPHVKIYLIAFTWSITALLPFIDAPLLMPFDKWLLHFFEKFLLILALTIPFDIRDLPYDRSELKTYPQILGIKSSKLIALLFLIVHGLLFWFLNDLDFFTQMSIYLSLAGILIALSEPEKKEWWFSFSIEAIPVLLTVNITLPMLYV